MFPFHAMPTAEKCKKREYTHDNQSKTYLIRLSHTLPHTKGLKFRLPQTKLALVVFQV